MKDSARIMRCWRHMARVVEFSSCAHCILVGRDQVKRPFSMSGRDLREFVDRVQRAQNSLWEGFRGRDVERTDSVREFPCYFYKYRRPISYPNNTSTVSMSLLP
jgi:hypothetical protein